MTLPDAIPKLAIRHELWRRGELSYKLDSLQQHIKRTIEEREDAQTVCVLSSRQIGKSFGALVYAMEFCIKHPRAKVRFLSATRTQVMDIVQDNMGPIIEDAPPGFIRPSRSEYRWTFENGSQIRLGAMERQYVDANRGGHSHLVIYEEGGFIPSEDYIYAIKSVIGPQLTRARQLTGKPGRELHISTPSEDEYHYLHEEVLPQAELLGTAFRYTIDDSPSITPEMRAECVQRSGGEDTDSFKREYQAQIIRSLSLMVVPEYDDDKHSAEFDLPEYYTALVAIDSGGVKDKTAGLSLAYDFKAGRILVWDEFLFDPNTATDVWVKAALGLEAGLSWFDRTPRRIADVPGQLQVDLISLHQYPVVLPNKDDADAAIRAVRIGFKIGQIMVHKRCKYLRGNLKTGRYNERRTDFHRTELYGHNDPIMALVYGNRMADKTTNPYPERQIDRTWQIRNPRSKAAEDARLEALASELVPYDPMRRR